MTSHLSRLTFLSLLTAGLSLTACNSPDEAPATVAGPAPTTGTQPDRKPTAYETEILSLKARIADATEREAAIRAAMIRYGFQPAEVPAPAAQEAHPAAVPLAKAASGTSRVIRAKDFRFGFARVITKRITVSNNTTLTAYTSRAANAQSVDPRIVAFYPELPDAGRTTTRIVGLNDDFNGLDSRFTWKNTTGSARTVTIHVFAYSTTATGSATLNYLTTSWLGFPGPTSSLSGPISAVAVTSNIPPSYPCADGPATSDINLFPIVGGGFNSGLVAVNISLMRGGYLHEANPQMTMPFVIAPNTGDFVLGIFEGDGSSFYENTQFEGIQDDYHPFCL